MSKRTFLFLVSFLGLALVGSIAAGYWLVSGGRIGQTETADLIGGPFSLTDETGATLSNEDLKGRYMMVFFGYTYCPDVCPTTLTVVTQALDMLEPEVREKVEPVFITIDPARDTSEALAAYSQHFHDRIHYLTGTPEQIGEVAKAYRVFYQKVESEEFSDYLMDHSTITYLMGPDGRYVSHYGFNSEPDEIAKDLTQRIAG
ncbi:SCO family protein [Nisaea acidiphila]|uniref:SCO family protein n=1 Tax=Nisaea acidiphila TaxID=1862145 RepID=A0A9J7AZ58_9PROT|nr:SCO family protein [Nisaea acidiphila]UUX52066.1 SCO family protein [Nisaea acidiphila]